MSLLSARACIAWSLIGLIALTSGSKRAPGASSAGIPVHYPEGTVHGFVELRTDGGALLAHGDLLQVVKGKSIESRMVFHFADSTVFEETVAFTQDEVFAMQRYTLVQRGSVFPFDLDVSLDRSGEYVVKTKSKAKDAKEERYTGKLDLPPDTYNGMAVVIAKNISTRDSTTVHIVAFTPQPRLIGLQFAPSGTEKVLLGQHEETATNFALKPKLGTVTHALAKLVGKAPPNSAMWIVHDDVPAFVRFEGPMYYGPVFRLTLASPQWPSSEAPSR